ncbi:MAG TPA: histidine kinase [Saprospiraceae bacterium]|nr:histidine kinase [Saprospiraceae bacterium]HRV83922.1 histidine kinase [Saprospiraceae bacterium]
MNKSLSQSGIRSFWGQLPVPYLYMILLGIGLGLLLGLRFYFTFWMSGEITKWTFENYFIPPFTNQTLWGFIAPLVYWALLQFPVGKGTTSWRWAQAIGFSMVIAMFHEIMSYVVWWVPYHLTGYEKITWEMIRNTSVRIPAGFIGQWVEYWVLYLVFAGIDSSRKFKQKELELVRLESQRNQSQLDALRLQLQPHFLFNTLNTISSLVDIDPKAAQTMVRKLGDLLRGLLATHENHLIPFEKELEFVRNYLDIEQVRFNDRLRIDYDIDPGTHGVLVPAFILQPLMENALKHGFSGRLEACTIRVSAKWCDGDRLCLKVADDGKGATEAFADLFQKGIGLRNVKERLELIYQDQASLVIAGDRHPGFVVTVVLPKKMA